jgi:hypothetical protein
LAGPVGKAHVKLAIDILVFLSIAVVVPVVIARLVVRAD